jgi:hypothetical protein
MKFALTFAIAIALWGTSSVVLGSQSCDVNGVSNTCCSDTEELLSKNGGALQADLEDCALETDGSCNPNSDKCTIDFRTFYSSKHCVDKVRLLSHSLSFYCE